jgi:SOS-response transcriptional repressor LexA
LAKESHNSVKSPTEPGESEVEKALRTDHIATALVEITDTRGIIPISADAPAAKNIRVMLVKGDSMIRDHLLAGDHLILEKLNTPGDGDMVAALVRNRRTVIGRFYRADGRIRLEACDPGGETMILDESDVTVEGAVVGIIRKYRNIHDEKP